MVVSHRPRKTIVLIIGTPKKAPLILGNPYVRVLLLEYRNRQLWERDGSSSIASFFVLHFGRGLLSLGRVIHC